MARKPSIRNQLKGGKPMKPHEQLSEHFALGEFRCKCGCSGHERPEILNALRELAGMLELLRTCLGKPITITSGFRCVAHNTKVGGEPNSYHTKGMAADIQVKGLDPKVVAATAASLKEVGGLGRYPSWTHVDTRSYRAIWHG